MDEETEKLRLIIDTTVFGPRQQLADVDALDGKVTQIFAAASVVIGLAAFLVGAAGEQTVTVLLLIAGLAYVVSAGAALFALYPRVFRGAHMANSLLTWSAGRSLVEIEQAIAESVPAAWETNRRNLEPKNRGLQVALWSCALEVGAVAAALIASRVIGA